MGKLPLILIITNLIEFVFFYAECGLTKVKAKTKTKSEWDCENNSKPSSKLKQKA